MKRRTEHEPWDSESTEVRVLLECSPSSSPSIIASVIADRGFAVRVCEGPGSGRSCDLIDHGSCALVSGADVVVNMLRGPDARARDVLDAVSDERRPPAVVVEMTKQRLDEEPVDQSRAAVLVSPASSEKLVAAIHAALEQR